MGPSHPTLCAITEAASLLRNKPGQALAKGGELLDADAFGDDVPLRTLAGMVNGSMRAVAAQAGVPYVADTMKGDKNICAKAEGHWVTVLDMPDDGADRALAQIFSTDGSPVLGRKDAGVQTGLTFVEMNIGGVLYPPGSIINLWAHGDVHQAGRVKIDIHGFELWPVAALRRASFLRLSAFALPEAQRDAYGVQALGQGRSIEQLAATAAEIQGRPSSIRRDVPGRLGHLAQKVLRMS